MSGERALDVLVISDFYPPAFRVGGPVRSLENLVARLGTRVRMRVVASAYDMGSSELLPGIRPDEWQPRGPASVLYLTDPARLSGLLGAERGSVLYLNSLFAPAYTLRPLVMRRLGRMRGNPVVIAPRGQLYPSALRHKRAKKLAFLLAARAAQLYRGVIWQATTEDEGRQIRRWFGSRARIEYAGNLATRPAPGRLPHPRKVPGELRIAYMSRVAPIKNLDGALRLLAGVAGRITFDIWGPQEDERYLLRCRELARALAPGVEVEFRGAVPHADVPGVLAGYHLFLLPTHGENFGHAIVDALGAGLPVLISDRTPWRGLAARRAGWDLPLDEPERFRDALRAAVAMDQGEWERWSRGAGALAETATGDSLQEESTLRMFQSAAASVGGSLRHADGESGR